MTGKKIVLDLDPQGPITFTRGVKIPTGDGKPLEIEFEFLFRDRVAMAELMPTSSPLMLTSAPPEFPGLRDASVWMTSPMVRPFCARRLRPTALSSTL